MEKSRFTTGKVRLSYQSIWETKVKNGIDTKMYTACIIIDKSDTKTVNFFEEAILEQQGFLKALNGGKMPTGNNMNPLKDGDVAKAGDPTFANSYFVNMSTKFKPTVVDRKRAPLTDPSSVVSGDFIRLFVNLYNFNVPGNVGVGVGFGGIQFLEKGEYLGGTGSQFDDEYSDASSDTDFDDDLPI